MIRSLARTVKHSVKKALGIPVRRLHPDWRLLEQTGPVEGEHLVIDVGCFQGWFADCWDKWCPRTQIHAFEPTRDRYENLRKQFAGRRNIVVNSQALGASEGKQAFYRLSNSPASNSCLRPLPAGWERIRYDTGDVIETEVELIRLDDYCSANGLGDVHLIKVDVQGYEMEAFKGAVEVLKRTRYVFVETAIQPLYENGSSFGQIVDFMTANGFDLIDLRAWHRGNRALVEADLLFRRQAIAPANDAEEEKLYRYLS
jgi:FkbM family methyltransferase